MEVTNGRRRNAIPDEIGREFREKDDATPKK
jgi:hypothetical protein